MREKHIVNTRTVTALHPVSSDSQDSHDMMELEVNRKMEKFYRIEVIRVLHESAELILGHLDAAGLRDIKYITKGCKHIFCNLLLTLYIADLSKGEVMLRMNVGTLPVLLVTLDLWL